MGKDDERKRRKRVKPLFPRTLRIGKALTIPQLRRKKTRERQAAQQSAQRRRSKRKHASEEEPAAEVENEYTAAKMAYSILLSSGMTAFLRSIAGGSLRGNNLLSCLKRAVSLALFVYEMVR